MSSESVSCLHLDPKVEGKHGASGNDAMLIGVIDAVEHPKGITVGESTVTSPIRLDALNDCLVICGHSVCFGSSSGFISVASVKDRKLPAPLWYLCREDVGEVIQRGSQLMGDFASEKHGRDGWFAETHILGKEAKSARLEIWLNSRCECTSLKGSDIMLESSKVLTCPFNLGIDAL
jgi:hypothetical protein